MIARHLMAALLAGIIAGVIATIAQQARVVPLILEAEKYEVAPAHHHDAPAATPSDTGAAATAPAETHSHDHGAEAPAAAETADEGGGMLFGESRLFNTLMANLVTGAGYSLILLAAVLLLGQSVTLANAVAWGASGWLAFQLLPSIGLPPELPGMPAGDLQGRQIWWLAQVVATAGGLYLLVFRREVVAKILGLVVLFVPLIIGAPKPDSIESAVPATLAAEFAVASLATGLIFWMAIAFGQAIYSARIARS